MGKKLKSAARFGARYGLKIRRVVDRIEALSRAKYECPNCFKKTLKRESAGIWICRSCGYKMAGGAYQPFTDASKIMETIFKRGE